MSLTEQQSEYARNPEPDAVSMLQMLDLYPRQVASIRHEATTALNSLIDDFFEHFAALGNLPQSKDELGNLQGTCSTIIEKLQYVDTLSQRLEQLEKGLTQFADSIQHNPAFLDSCENEFDGQAILHAQIKSTRMSQEREVLDSYLRDHNLALDSSGDS